MTAFPAALSSAPTVAAFDDDAWQDLLDFVEKKPVNGMTQLARTLVGGNRNGQGARRGEGETTTMVLAPKRNE